MDEYGNMQKLCCQICQTEIKRYLFEGSSVTCRKCRLKGSVARNNYGSLYIMWDIKGTLARLKIKEEKQASAQQPKKTKLITCEFTSIWDDGSEITTPCTYDPKTGEVFPKSSKSAPEGCMVREYITLPDEELEVCTNCHGYVLKSVIGDRADLSYGEYTECPNPDCEGI